MVDDVATRIVDVIIRFPISHTINIQVVPQKTIQKVLRCAKLAHRQDVGLHIVHQGPDALVLALRVVVCLIAVSETTIVVAVFQEVVLHHGQRILRHNLRRKRHQEQDINNNVICFLSHIE